MRKSRVLRAPVEIGFDCDVVEPPGRPRGQEVRDRLVVRALSTARLPRGEIAGRAEEEVGWYDLRRPHPARRGGAGGGGGGVEQLLDSEEEEPTAMSRPLRGERDHVSRDYQEGYLGDFRDLRDLRDLRDYHRDPLDRDIRDERNGQGHREGPSAGRPYRDDYPEEYDHRPTAASASANLTNNPVSHSHFLFWINWS